MKTQTLKLFVVLLLITSSGCTNGNLDSELENLNKKEKLEAEARKGFGDPCITYNEMPDGTQYLVFTVDMNYQEVLMLNNPEVAGFNGNFEDFYREYMSNLFTIYNIQVSQSCSGFERWTVDLAEYNAFEGTFNGVYILPDNDVNGGTNTTNNNNGTNSESAGPIDINGNPIAGGSNDDDDNEDDEIEIGLPTATSSGGIPFNCFVGGCNFKFVD
nr:hypothetical protein [uncultured Psychroserpens sp.]